jgi:hypothetical protein
MKNSYKLGILLAFSFQFFFWSPLAVATNQSDQHWTDESRILFRGQPIDLGMEEQAFRKMFSAAFHSSVTTDLREPGALPTVYSSGMWKLLEPTLTTKETVLGKDMKEDWGVFYFQTGRLVAAEISRSSDDPANPGDLTANVLKALRSMGAEGRSCSVNSFSLKSETHENDSLMVQVRCGRHYLTMSRTLLISEGKPILGYTLIDGLLDENARLTQLEKTTR